MYVDIDRDSLLFGSTAGFQPHAPGAPPRPQRPSIPETKEMAQRAETIVQILFKLADESRPIRKALDNSTLNNANSAQQQRAPTPIVNVNYPDRDPATGKKKRKMSERERDNENAPQHANGGAENEDGADENDPPHANGAEGGAEAEWGMTKEQRLKMFGENQEAFDLAEKDMRTITAKRTASQGGVLPQQKTKYKKRSVSRRVISHFGFLWGNAFADRFPLPSFLFDLAICREQLLLESAILALVRRHRSGGGVPMERGHSVMLVVFVSRYFLTDLGDGAASLHFSPMFS